MISFENGDEIPYESQSEVELQEAIKLLCDSQEQIHHAEVCADEFISKAFVGRANSQEYVSLININKQNVTFKMIHNKEDILQQCSRNVKILFNMLDSVSKGDSFVSQKKCRETRCKRCRVIF